MKNSKTVKTVKTKSKWKTIGFISVDSGQVWISDPCYVIHKNPLPPSLGNDWGDYVNEVYSNHFRDNHATEPFKSFTHKGGHEGLGINISTPHGDGVYEVQAKMKDRKISEIRIKFD